MTEQTMTLQQKKKLTKKAYKGCKRKHVTLWKVLAIVCAVVLVITSAASVLLNMFDNTVAAFLGGTFWELEHGDPNAIYYEMDFASNEEMYDYGDELCRQVEAEGAVLLMNNGALPLGEGAKVSTLSSNSVNLV